jgi:hypothetical protein
MWLRRVTVLLWQLACVVCADRLCKQTGPCSCQMTDGSGVLDLSRQANSGGTARYPHVPTNLSALATKHQDNQTFYSYNPCYNFTIPKTVCKNVALCANATSGPDLKIRTYRDFGDQPLATFGDDPKGKVYIQYAAAGMEE